MPNPERGPQEILKQITFPIEHKRNEQVSNVAVLLPGQDVQKEGMLDSVMSHSPGKEVVERADNLLQKEFGFRISDITHNPNLLKRTEFTQPAVFVLTMALHNINKYEKSGNKEGHATLPQLITGNSMGIVSAITLSGGLSFEEGLRLITMRGKIMQQFADQRPTAMKATLNSNEEQVRQMLSRYPDIDMCLINSDSVFVYGGPLESLGKMSSDLKTMGIKVVDINTDRAMHSRYITPAKDKFCEYVNKINFSDPIIPIVGTLNEEPITTAQGIKEELIYGFDHTFDNRKILKFLDEAKVPIISEVNEKGSLSKSMERMFKAMEEHKLLTLGAAVIAGIGIYRVVTRHHHRYPHTNLETK